MVSILFRSFMDFFLFVTEILDENYMIDSFYVLLPPLQCPVLNMF